MPPLIVHLQDPGAQCEQGVALRVGENVEQLRLGALRDRLLIYHFMFGPSYAIGCPVNSSIADSFDCGGT